MLNSSFAILTRRLGGLVVSLIIAGSLIMVLGPVSNVEASNGPNPASYQNRMVIFVHGTRLYLMDGHNCAKTNVKTVIGEETFGSIKRYLLSHNNYMQYRDEDFLYYSYGSDDTDNCDDVLNLGGDFHKYFREHPNATFDIIGHSLGGAWAAYWLATSATDQERARVHSLITIESPLQGVVNPNDIVLRLGQWGLNLGGQRILNLCQIFRTKPICSLLDPNGYEVKGAIANAVTVANIFYIHNKQDTIVKFDEARLNGAIELAQLDKSSANGYNAHELPLHDSTSIELIRSIMSRDYYRPYLASLRYSPEGDGYGGLLPYCCQTSSVQLSGNGWWSWKAPWLFTRRSYETSTKGNTASLNFYGQGVVWRTQSDKGRGTAIIRIDGREVSRINLKSNQYNDVDKSFEVGLELKQHNITIEALGDGSLNVNTLIVKPLPQDLVLKQPVPPPPLPTPVVSVITVNDEAGDFQRFGPAQYWYRNGNGQNGGSWWTRNSAYWVGPTWDDYAAWAPKIPATANYTVEVFIPDYATARKVWYEVYSCGDQRNNVAVDQLANRGKWLTLGTFCMPAGQATPGAHKGGNITLTDVDDGQPSLKNVVVWDTLRLTRK